MKNEAAKDASGREMEPIQFAAACARRGSILEARS